MQSSIYPPVVQGQPLEQHNMIPPQIFAPKLSYPIVYRSAKPIATEPVILDDASIARGFVEPQGCFDKVVKSFSSASNNFQVCDLIDATDMVTFRCSRCQYEGFSKPMNTIGPCTYFGIIALCCICGPCGVIPCFCKKCQYIQHYCPQCGQKIGVTYPGP